MANTAGKQRAGGQQPPSKEEVPGARRYAKWVWLPPAAELPQLLGQVLGAAMEVLEAEKGTVHLHDPSDGTLKTATQLGFEQTFIDRFGSVDARSSLWGSVFQGRKRTVVEDIADDPALEGTREAFVANGVRSLQCVPLLGGNGQPLGVLSIYRADAHRPFERELWLFDLFSHQAEQAIETKQAEEAKRWNEAGLRLALEAGQMGSWEWNIRSGEIRWSDNLEEIHGLASGSFGGTFDAYKALIHPDDREGVLEAIRRSVESGADYEAEFRSASSNKESVRWMLGKGKVLTDEQGSPVRMIGVCMDVTKRKRAEEAILEADRRKDEFLAMISHEIRNPLSAIMNASAVLDRVAAGDPAWSKTRAVIRRQTEQLTRIVDDLLDISRLNAGKLSLERTQLDLGSLVDRSVKELAGRHAFDRHRVELRLGNAPVHGDSARLEQVFTNLLTNALKYTPAGGIVVVEVGTEGDQAVLRVRDSGIGIAPELLPRIFDLFVQSERGLDRRDGGLGVGLSIVRQLVEAHGGRVEAESAGPHRGSEFVVRLPLVTTPDARSALAGGEAGTSARKRILVIDDNQDAREGLVALLKLAGHTVQEAEDGPSGLERVSRLRPDVVLVDIGLPGFDGFELARRLRSEGSEVHLVALTGYGHPDYRRLGAEAGFDDYLVKPVKLDAVLRVLAAARESKS